MDRTEEIDRAIKKWIAGSKGALKRAYTIADYLPTPTEEADRE